MHIAIVLFFTKLGEKDGNMHAYLEADPQLLQKEPIFHIPPKFFEFARLSKKSNNVRIITR